MKTKSRAEPIVSASRLSVESLGKASGGDKTGGEGGGLEDIGGGIVIGAPSPPKISLEPPAVADGPCVVRPVGRRADCTMVRFDMGRGLCSRDFGLLTRRHRPSLKVANER